MGNLIANTCWPARFPAKWLAFFGVALFVGTVYGFTHHKALPHPASPQIQANIVVLARYKDEAGYKRTRAKVYFASKREEMQESQVIRVGVGEAALRTQAAHVPIDFMVQPLDDAGNIEGTPVYQQVIWPEQKNAEVPLQIQRAYTRPKH